MLAKEKKYLRVTEVLNPYSGYGQIDPDVLKRAQDRGTHVHQVIENDLKGEMVFCLPEFSNYYESFKKWKKEPVNIYLQEQRFYDDELGITGACDLILSTDEGNILIDFKTSYSKNDIWPLQGAAYAYLARKAGHKVDRIKFVHLNKTGKEPSEWDVTEFEESYFVLFKSCLRLYRMFFETKKTPLLFDEWE